MERANVVYGVFRVQLERTFRNWKQAISEIKDACAFHRIPLNVALEPPTDPIIVSAERPYISLVDYCIIAHRIPTAVHEAAREWLKDEKRKLGLVVVAEFRDAILEFKECSFSLSGSTHRSITEAATAIASTINPDFVQRVIDAVEAEIARLRRFLAEIDNFAETVLQAQEFTALSRKGKTD